MASLDELVTKLKEIFQTDLNCQQSQRRTSHRPGKSCSTASRKNFLNMTYGSR